MRIVQTPCKCLKIIYLGCENFMQGLGYGANMCGRYFRRSDKQRIAEVFHLGVFEDLPLEVAPSYNIAPTTMQPVIRNNRDTGEREMVAMRWGMVPNFAKSLADFKGFSTINAKAETLLSKPLWRTPFHRRRCLIPADGFYEWVRPESRPDDCPAWSHDRTCRPIGSTLGGQASW